jgi:hypothetical protein
MWTSTLKSSTRTDGIMKSAGTEVAALNVNATWVPAGCKQQSVCQEVFPICDSASLAADVVLPAGGNRGFV